MKIIEYCFFSGGFWVRFFGYGVRVINRDKVPAPFSIRNGFKMEMRTGKWGIITLSPVKDC